MVIFFYCLPIISSACEITFHLEGAQKMKYNAGDIAIIKISVVRTHRNCSVDLKETKIQASGMKIIGATKWVNTDGNTWERKLKVRITSNKEGKATITAKRTCNRDGGFGTFELQAVPVK